MNKPEDMNQMVLMKFGERAPKEICVICGKKVPIMNMKNIVFLDIESNKKGVYSYHEKCLPKLTKDFAESLTNVKNSNDLMNLKKYVIL
jgi:hypothetical protein